MNKFKIFNQTSIRSSKYHHITSIITKLYTNKPKLSRKISKQINKQNNCEIKK